MKAIALIVLLVGVPILIGVWIRSGPTDEPGPAPMVGRGENLDADEVIPVVVPGSPSAEDIPPEPASESKGDVVEEALPTAAPPEESSKSKVERMLHDLLVRQSREEAMRGWDRLDEAARKSVIAELRSRLHGRAGRYKAAVALWRVTGESGESVEVLLDGFDREPRRSWGNSWQYLCGLLSEMGPDAAGAVPGLIELYDTRQWRPEESDWIFYAFAKIGPAAKEALPLIREGIAHEHEKIRTIAAYALWGVTGEHEKPVDVLIASLEVDDLDVRAWAAGYLGEIGPKAARAVPLLEAAMKARESPYGGLYHRVPAAAAHWRITGRTEKALPVLIAGLSGNDYPAWVAAKAFAEMGPKAKSALPALRRVVKRRTGLVGRAVREAIAAVQAK